LIITIEEIPHESLERDDNNLLYDLNINIADAALGISVEVPTIDGKARIKVPAGTQSGKIFRLRGKGLWHSSNMEEEINLFRLMYGHLKNSMTKKKRCWIN
jgi:DnaJ-class molecular chaperone